MTEDFFESSFLKIRSKLLRAAVSILNNNDEAADMLQEAFCRLWPKRKNLKNEAEASAMAYTTVKNLSIDALRRRKPTTNIDMATETVAEEMAGPNEAERKARYKAVMQLVDEKLSPLQRDILRRRDIEGQRLEDIARRLGMQEAAVRMNLSRARRTIKALYYEQHHE